MRLIDVRAFRQNGGLLKIVEFGDSSIPAYTILSHTWLPRGEVTLSDTDDRAKSESLPGYAKIRLACEQTLRDGYDYLWVDTCCIDKTNGVELSQAINSMYRWYEAAEVCYVYLADLSKGPINAKTDASFTGTNLANFYLDPSSNEFQRQAGWFRACRWFTRGWTLQELVAPRRVNFYNSRWTWVGSRESLRGILSDITSVDVAVLTREHKCQDLSVAKRLSWAAKRRTARVEDRAYSMLGILGIHMSLLYGEGENAFIRLQREILANTLDLSLLLWNRSLASENQRWSLLAPSLTYFEGCNKVFDSQDDSISSMITNRGLRLSVDTVEDTSHPDHPENDLVVLPYYMEDDYNRFLAIHVTPMEQESLVDNEPIPYLIQPCHEGCAESQRSYWSNTQLHSLDHLLTKRRIRQDILIWWQPDTASRYAREENWMSMEIGALPDGFTVTRVHPEFTWNLETLTMNRHKDLTPTDMPRVAGVQVEHNDGLSLRLCIAFFRHSFHVRFINSPESLQDVCRTVSASLGVEWRSQRKDTYKIAESQQSNGVSYSAYFGPQPTEMGDYLARLDIRRLE